MSQYSKQYLKDYGFKIKYRNKHSKKKLFVIYTNADVKNIFFINIKLIFKILAMIPMSAATYKILFSI